MTGLPSSQTTSTRERVLLLHCSAGSGRGWRFLTEALERAFGGLAVAAPDIEGYGERAAVDLAGPAGLAPLAAPLLRQIEEDGGRLHLVGHSFGGALALELASRLGGRLASLTLIEPVAFHLLRDGDFADRQLFREVSGLAARLHLALERDAPGEGMAAFVDYWNGRGSWAALDPAQQRQLAVQAPAVARDFRAIFAEAPAFARYRRIVAPCLVLHGELSPRPARRVAEIVARALPWAAGRRIHGAGHMLPLTHRAEVAAAVVEQLRAFARAAPLPERALAAAS